MSIVSPPRPRAKSTLPVSSCYHACHRGAGTLDIRRGDRLESYTCRETTTRDLPEFGGVRSFRLTKDADGKAYDCLIADDFAESTCDCADFTFRDPADGPYLCKHLVAIQAALEAGEIDSEDAERPADEASLPVEADAPAGPVQDAVPAPAGGGPVDPVEDGGTGGDGDGGEMDADLRGPWEAVGGSMPELPFWTIRDADGRTVEFVSDAKGRGYDAVKRIAHLNAAGPSLLGVARLALRVCSPEFIAAHPDAATLRAKAEDAIARVKGGA